MADNKTIEIVISANTDGIKKGSAETVTALKQVEAAADSAGRTTATAMEQAGKNIESSTVPAAGRLAGALMNLVNPANLAATAVTLLGGAIVTYVTSGLDKIATLDEVLKQHAEVIKAIGLAYPEAIKGLEEFEKKSDEVLKVKSQESIRSLQEKVQQLSEAIVNSISSTRPALDEITIMFGNVDAAGTTLKKGFEAFQAPILAFNDSVKRGTPDLQTFERAVAALALQFQDDASIQKYANELLKIISSAEGVAVALNKAGASAANLDLEISGAAESLRKFEAAMKTIQGISPTPISDRTKLENAYAEALAAGNIEGAARIKLEAERAAALKRISDAEAAKVKPAAVEDDGMTAQMQRRMQFIIDSTLTEEQLLIARYERNRLLLQEAFAIELADTALHGEAKAALKAEQDAVIEALDAKHQQNMQRMQAATDARTLGNMASTFGSIASIIESGGKKGAAAAKAFYIAQALMSTFSAATQAMADPTLVTPFQKFVAYAAIAAKGLAAVASIKSVNSSGGGGGGGGAAAAGAGGGGAAAPSPTTTFQFTMANDPMGFGEKFARQFIDQLNSTQRNGGQIRGVMA